MDSKGMALDNVIIERFWVSLKREKVYINEYESIKALKEDIGAYVNYYNSDRVHQGLNNFYPNEVYNGADYTQAPPLGLEGAHAA